jgi:histidine triad (HIT) family protein
MTRKPYDETNVFARILRGEIPCKKAFENDHVLAFHDIGPQAPVHILVIPKGKYVDVDDFGANASVAEAGALLNAIAEIVTQEDLVDGYRLIANTGAHGGQEVPHFHMHLLAGEKIGPMRAAS